MPISAYPDFTPLAIDDSSAFDRAFRADPPRISELTFTNLYSWREAYRLRAAVLDECIILRSDTAGPPCFFYPIGSGNKRAVIARIMGDTEGVFIRIPEALVSLFSDNSRIIVTEDRDNADYLYRVSDLTELSGRKYDGKRNLIKKFKSDYKYEYVKLDARNAGACLDFERVWCEIKDCDGNEGLSRERKAIGEMIDNFERFHLIGGAISIAGEIRAAAIGQALNPSTMVMHVLKADPEIPGLYQTINNEFLVRETSGFEFVNLEQDLGIEGLRKAKLSYHPCELIKKYTLRPATT